MMGISYGGEALSLSLVSSSSGKRRGCFWEGSVVVMDDDPFGGPTPFRQPKIGFLLLVVVFFFIVDDDERHSRGCLMTNKRSAAARNHLHCFNNIKLLATCISPSHALHSWTAVRNPPTSPIQNVMTTLLFFPSLPRFVINTAHLI